MKTMRNYTIELAENLKNGKKKEKNLYMITANLIDEALNGEIGSMFTLGYGFLNTARFNTTSKSTKEKYVELGIYWLNECVLNNNFEIEPCEGRILNALRNVGMAYEWLAAAYCPYLPEDWDNQVWGVTDMEDLRDLIPENKAKAWHYMQEGAKYSELCATELVISYLSGTLHTVDVEKAHDLLLEILETKKNTLYCSHAGKIPYFPSHWEGYNCYEHIASLFLKNGASAYAYELWNTILQPLEANESTTTILVYYGNHVDHSELISWNVYYNLSACYCNGIGIASNLEKAKELFIKAKALFQEENPDRDFLQEDKQANNLAKKLGLL